LGLSISWIAFRGKNKDEILALLDVRDSGEIDEANDAPVSGALLPNGWYVLVINDYRFVTPDRLGRYSTGCEVVACQIEEHVMASTVYIFKDGREQFWAHHEGDEGEFEVSTRGDPPPDYAAIHDRLMAEQTAEGDDPVVDYVFDIPLQTARSICGYQHNRVSYDWGEPKFTRLEPIAR
jgi:hypothetical protein